jgi:hypothetical protein
MHRWAEDVVLVEEEMRRTIEYGYWVASEWEKRGAARVAVVEEELLEGLKAYAREQATREKRTCASLTANWGRIRERGRAYLAGEMAPGVEVIVPLDDEEREPDEDHEGPPDYEDEGDDELLE